MIYALSSRIFLGIGHFGPYQFGPYRFGLFGPFWERHVGPSSSLIMIVWRLELGMVGKCFYFMIKYCSLIDILRMGRSISGHRRGAKVSFASGRSVFSWGDEVSWQGPMCLFQRGPKCPIGAEVVGAEVVGTEVSKLILFCASHLTCSGLSPVNYNKFVYF